MVLIAIDRRAESRIELSMRFWIIYVGVANPRRAVSFMLRARCVCVCVCLRTTVSKSGVLILYLPYLWDGVIDLILILMSL